jgi:hypothetical protein
MNTNSPALELDIELDLEDESRPEQEHHFSHDWMARLPGLLRTFGAGAILFSLYTFFARGWDGSSELIRYLMLLGHTGALAAIGLASGHFLREGKGARLLVILSMVSVVTNFAILGAFIVSVLEPGQWQGPQYLTWAVDTPMTAMWTTLGSLFVLIPVARIGFLTLARGISNPMTLMFLAGNAALLLPARTPLAATTLTIVMAGMLLFWCGDRMRKSTEVKTFEGMIALTLQFLPIGIILGRNVWLYAADSMLYTAGAVAAFIAVRQLSLFLPETSYWRRSGNFLSILLSCISGTGLFATLIQAGSGISLALVVATLAVAGMIYEVASRSGEEGGVFRSLATVVLVTGLGFNLLTYGGILATLLTMATGIALIVASYSLQKRNVFIGGAVLLVGSTLQQIIHAFRFFDLTGWATITLVGVAAILIGSLLESSVGQIKAQYGTWKSKYQDWNY